MKLPSVDEVRVSIAKTIWLYDDLTDAEKEALLSKPEYANHPQPIDYGLTLYDMNLHARERLSLLDYEFLRYKEESRPWLRRVVLRWKEPSANFLAFEEALRSHHLYKIAAYEAEQALLKRKRSYWESLDGYSFERATAEVLNKHQFNARVTRGSADGGVDIEVRRTDRKGVVQCKAHVACVGPHVVRDLYGVIHHSGANFGIIVSRGGFTRGAVEFAKDKPIYFLDTSDLIAMQEGRDVLAKAFIPKQT